MQGSPGRATEVTWYFFLMTNGKVVSVERHSGLSLTPNVGFTRPGNGSDVAFLFRRMIAKLFSFERLSGSKGRPNEGLPGQATLFSPIYSRKARSASRRGRSALYSLLENNFENDSVFDGRGALSA